MVRKVIIVGGGIAGPTLAMWLQRAGIDSVVLERRPAAADSEGAFLGLAPNGMNVLRDLGVAEAVRARGFACSAFRFHNAGGQTIGSIDRQHDEARFGAPLTMIRRAEVHRVLLDEAVRQGVSVRLGSRVTGLDRAAGEQVTARLEDGSVERGDVLIGCDGLRSTVRQLMDPDAPAPVFSGLWDCGGFVSGIDVPLTPGVNEMVFGRRAFFGAFLTPSGEVWWFHNGPPGSEGETAAETRARLLELHRDDPPWIREVIAATGRVLGPWPLFDLRDSKRWVDGRVGLIGDAAHAMSPSAGQGASMAIEDALVLARCLRDVSEPERALAEFERLRRPRVDAIARQARRNGSNKAVENPVALWMRDRLLPFFLKLGASGQDQSYAYRLAWESSSTEAQRS